MTGAVLAIDIVAAILCVAGFLLAFRFETIRRWWGGAPPPSVSPGKSSDEEEDEPLVYALRIAGVMLMAFSAAIALLFTIFSQSSGAVQ